MLSTLYSFNFGESVELKAEFGLISKVKEIFDFRSNIQRKENLQLHPCINCYTVWQDSEYVVAVRNFINEDRALLNFHKGDIIRLQQVDGLEAGEMQRNPCAEIMCVFCICEPESVCVSAALLLTLLSFTLCVRLCLSLHCAQENITAA